MTPAEIQALTAPVSDDEPCGPDLEMLGDADYMRFVARIEVAFPASYAQFDRSKIDFPAEFATLRALLNRSRDLRLLGFLAKLSILNRDLAAFVATVQTMETLTIARWDHVHPQLLDGDAILRTIAIRMLGDIPDSVMPLQNAPLFETRQLGPVSYRAWLLATGQLQARAGANEDEKGEDVLPASAMSNALEKTAEVEQFIRARGLIIDLRQSLASLDTFMTEKAPDPEGLKFEKLNEMAQAIYGFLEKIIAARDPALALEAPAAAADDGRDGGQDDSGLDAAILKGAVRSQDDARAAFAAATRYFVSFEPSSPVLFLIAQAEALMGKNFFEAMQALTPEYAGQAAIGYGRGRDLHMRLPFERLSALSPGASLPPEEDSSGGDGSWNEEQPASDGWGSGEESSDGAEISGESEANSETSGPAGAPAHSPASFSVRTRRDAMTLLDEIAAYFRAAEPSSPIPSLLDHARSLAGRDFFGLLREMLPASALRVDE